MRPCIRSSAGPYLLCRCDPWRARPLAWWEPLALWGRWPIRIWAVWATRVHIPDGTPARDRKVVTVRINGTLKFYNSAKGFGFITPEDGSKDVFVHATALEAADIDSLNEGDKVSFVLEDDQRGRGKQAAQLKKS